MTDTPDPLLPCPFCGSDDLCTDNARDFIACCNCGTEGPVGIGQGSAHNIERWNARASLAAPGQAPQPVLTVAGDPNNPKFQRVFVGPPAFTEIVQLEAGTKLYTAPAEQAAATLAFVPVHPRNGPLWSETFPAASDVSQSRSQSYPLMALCQQAPAAAPAGQAAAPIELSDDDWQAIADDADIIVWSRLKQAVDARLASKQAPAAEAVQPLDSTRWNFEANDTHLLVCRDLHDKGDDCDYQPMHPAEVLALVNDLRSRVMNAEMKAQAVQPNEGKAL